MDFEKDNFEDDNELSRLEEEDELGTGGDEIVETEEEEILITEEDKEEGEESRQEKEAALRVRIWLDEFDARKGLGHRPSLFFLKTFQGHSGTRSAGMHSHLRTASLSNRESRGLTKCPLAGISPCR